MPTQPQKPVLPTEAPCKAENDATATPSTKTSPGHEPTEVIQIAHAKDGGDEAGPVLAPGLTIPRPIKTVECNMMSYTDGDGVARKIYMPKGTAGLAGALYTAKRFDDLAKFPAWGE